VPSRNKVKGCGFCLCGFGQGSVMDSGEQNIGVAHFRKGWDIRWRESERLI